MTGFPQSNIDWSKYMEGLQGKANVDLANTTEKLSNNFLDKITPDTTAGIAANGLYNSFENAFIAPTDGILVYFVFFSTKGGDTGVYINNIKISPAYGSGGGSAGTSMPSTFILKKGDKIHFKNVDGAAASGYGGTFFPLKGAN